MSNLETKSILNNEEQVQSVKRKTDLCIDGLIATSENQVIIDELVDILSTKLVGFTGKGVCGNSDSLQPQGFFGNAIEKISYINDNQLNTIAKLKELNDII